VRNFFAWINPCGLQSGVKARHLVAQQELVMQRQIPQSFDRTSHVRGVTPRGTPPVEGRGCMQTAPRSFEERSFAPKTAG
jgi:hypothetical protein